MSFYRLDQSLISIFLSCKKLTHIKNYFFLIIPSILYICFTVNAVLSLDLKFLLFKNNLKCKFNGKKEHKSIIEISIRYHIHKYKRKIKLH